MADKNQLKMADPIDLADDDPFAELTRIMGFDPRQPAKRPEPAPVQPLRSPEHAAQPASVEHDLDDFSLDLEKELLGGFDLGDDQPSTAHADQPDAAEPHDIAEVGEIDFDFGEAFEAMPEPQSPVSQSPESAAASASYTVEERDPAIAAIDAADAPADVEMDFDLRLSDDDVAAPGETASGNVSLPVAPYEVAPDAEFDLDAAMADIDMSFLDDQLSEDKTAAMVEAMAPAAETDTSDVPAADPVDVGSDLLDYTDFGFVDEVEDAEDVRSSSEALAALPEGEMSAAIDDAPDLVSTESYRDGHATGADIAATVEDEFAFDHLDFAEELDTTEWADEHDGSGGREARQQDEPVVGEQPSEVGELTSSDVDARSASTSEFVIPPYVPRKLPTSPMDVAAEEFRQREAATRPVEPQFSLEEELNALLGNAGSMQSSADENATSSADLAAVSSPYLGEHAYRTATSDIADHFGSGAASQADIAFEAPEHPVDMEDALSWELEDLFAPNAEAVQSLDEPPSSVADDRNDFATDGTIDPAYRRDHEAGEDLATADLEAVFEELSEDPVASHSESHVPENAGAMLGAAAWSGYSHTTPSLGSNASGQLYGDEGTAARLGSHRDPVVRGNPMAEDPLDVITQLAEQYSRKEPVTPPDAASFYDRHAGYEADGDIDISDAFADQPEVETIEVEDKAIALADDLDIPELPEEEALPPSAAYDDLDTEFSSLLGDMNSDPALGQGAASHQDPLKGGFSARPYEIASVATLPGAAVARQQLQGLGPQSFETAGEEFRTAHSSARQAVDDYDYDPDFEQEIAPQYFAEAQRKKPASRGFLGAGVIAGVALIGAIGAFAFSFGGGGDAPALVRAEDGPIKIRPENPGGTTVPNQDSTVYETVAGQAGDEAPQQETLVTTAEEPVDIMPTSPAGEDDESVAASGKNEDRIEQIVQEAERQSDAEIAAVAPRKVRTMMVKPDGTLVPREDEPEPSLSGEGTGAIAALTESSPAQPAEAGAPARSAPDEVSETAAVEPASGETETPSAILDGEERGTMPDTVPIAPLRPAEQPIDVVGEVAPSQVAAATAAASAVGGWAMQIASQPSEAAAQASYQDLLRRHGSVLEGREVNIVKADIAGKGTFWRVRIPAGSRAEAINLCETYKAAGGNCFVSR